MARFKLARHSWTVCTFPRCRCCVSRTCGCIYERVLLFLDVLLLDRKQALVSPPRAVTHISNWPADSLSIILFSPSCLCCILPAPCGSVGRQDGPGSPIVLVPRRSRYRLNQSRMRNTDGHWLTDGFMENKGLRFPPLPAASSIFPPASALLNSPSSCAFPHCCLRLPVRVN